MIGSEDVLTENLYDLDVLKFKVTCQYSKYILAWLLLLSAARTSGTRQGRKDRGTLKQALLRLYAMPQKLRLLLIVTKRESHLNPGRLGQKRHSLARVSILRSG